MSKETKPLTAEEILREEAPCVYYGPDREEGIKAMQEYAAQELSRLRAENEALRGIELKLLVEFQREGKFDLRRAKTIIQKTFYHTLETLK